MKKHRHLIALTWGLQGRRQAAKSARGGADDPGLRPHVRPVYGPRADGKVSTVLYNKTCAQVRRVKMKSFKMVWRLWRP